MTAHERLMVASTLGEIRVGDQFESLPAHLTIYPWFNLASDKWSLFDEGMQDVAIETQAPTIKGGSRVFYGPDTSISARRLDELTRTFNVLLGFDIHAGVYRLVHQLGSNFDDTYTGLNWRPHISDTADHQFESQEEHLLSHVTVFEKDVERGRKIAKAMYKLREFKSNTM